MWHPVSQGMSADITLASSPGLAAMQAAAGRWLAERTEGGFSREVLSHFVFVLQLVLGQAVVEAARAEYPDDGRSSERALTASLNEALAVQETIEALLEGR